MVCANENRVHNFECKNLWEGWEEWGLCLSSGLAAAVRIQCVAWLCSGSTRVDMHVASHGWQGVLVELKPKRVEG